MVISLGQRADDNISMNPSGGLHDRARTTCVVVDDHPPIIDCLSRYLSAAGFTVLATAQDGEAALTAIETHRPVVCIAVTKYGYPQHPVMAGYTAAPLPYEARP